MNVKIKQNSMTIYLDQKNDSVSLYMASSNGNVTLDTRKINANFLSTEYCEKLTVILKEFVSKYAPSSSANSTIVLPDSCVFMNIVSFPTQKANDFKLTYSAYLTNQYKNNKDLIIKTDKIVYNKVVSTYSLVGIRKEIINVIKKVLDDAKLVVQNITCESFSDIIGITTLNQKLKGQSFLYLDIKEKTSKFILSYKGKPLGFFDLPLGYEILTDKPCAEDVMLYSPAAELLVVNAKEKANQKALTMSDSESKPVEQEDNDDNFFSDDLENAFNEPEISISRPQMDQTIKTLPKKNPRKLPKFMQRDVPDDTEHKVYENFRIFMRWALDILSNNEKLTSIVKPQTVFVNLPFEFSYCFDFANEELEENKVKFSSAGIAKEKEDIRGNVEKFGGFFIKDFKDTSTF